MVAPHSSSVIRTGDGYLALQQEQRAESASALALPHLRSASSSPAHIKDEVGIPSGLTASADKGNHSPSAPGAERSTSMGLDALEQAQSDAECALLLLCLQDQRPDLGAIQAPAVLDATLRASWRSVEWKEQGSIEDGYLLALDRYRSHLKCRKRRPEQDALPHVPFSLLNAEIRSAQTLLAHVRAGDRRAELELATAVQSWSWRIDTFGNTSDTTLLRPYDLHAPTWRYGRPYGVLLLDLQATYPSSVSNQAAVSRVAAQLKHASTLLLETELLAPVRLSGSTCYPCIKSRSDYDPKLPGLMQWLYESTLARLMQERSSNSDSDNRQLGIALALNTDLSTAPLSSTEPEPSTVKTQPLRSNWHFTVEQSAIDKKEQIDSPRDHRDKAEQEDALSEGVQPTEVQTRVGVGNGVSDDEVQSIPPPPDLVFGDFHVRHHHCRLSSQSSETGEDTHQPIVHIRIFPE
ncbi:hypothetical protein CF328_g8527 [Tilletia controversa]|nr:hypothetical protein CF328_g8527 [Tilletia controversa]